MQSIGKVDRACTTLEWLLAVVKLAMAACTYIATNKQLLYRGSYKMQSSLCILRDLLQQSEQLLRQIGSISTQFLPDSYFTSIYGPAHINKLN